MKCFKNNSENFTTNKNNQNRITNHFLTNREVEVLQLICDQKTTVEKFYILARELLKDTEIIYYLKPSLKNIAGLVFYAIQNNIVIVYN
jgi:hypothetical protein